MATGFRERLKRVGSGLMSKKWVLGNLQVLVTYHLEYSRGTSDSATSSRSGGVEPN